MLNNLKKLYKQEIQRTKNGLSSPYVLDKDACVWNAIQRCLGAADLIQIIDESVSYEEVEALFNETKKKLTNLLTEST